MDDIKPSDIQRALEETPTEALNATTALMQSFTGRSTRRNLLMGTMKGMTSLALVGTVGAVTSACGSEIVQAHAAYNDVTKGGSKLQEYFNILATGEELFATFYALGIAHSNALGIKGSHLTALKAIQAEEELHLRFAKSLGVPATNTFSFPHGADTFKKRKLFLQTQQLAEELTSGALLAWIKDMANMNLPLLAQIGGQLMQVEGGHRVTGRVILKANPFDNWAFAPVVLDNFLQVRTTVKEAGFLTPTPGNSFPYIQPKTLNVAGIINKAIPRL